MTDIGALIEEGKQLIAQRKASGKSTAELEECVADLTAKLNVQIVENAAVVGLLVVRLYSDAGKTRLICPGANKHYSVLKKMVPYNALKLLWNGLLIAHYYLPVLLRYAKKRFGRIDIDPQIPSIANIQKFTGSEGWIKADAVEDWVDSVWEKVWQAEMLMEQYEAMLKRRAEFAGLDTEDAVQEYLRSARGVKHTKRAPSHLSEKVLELNNLHIERVSESVVISDSFTGDSKYVGWLTYRNGQWFQLMGADGWTEGLITPSHPDFGAFAQEWEHDAAIARGK